MNHYKCICHRFNHTKRQLLKTKEGRFSESYMYYPKLNVMRVLSVISRHTPTGNDITQHQSQVIGQASGEDEMKKPDSLLPLKSCLYTWPLEIHSQSLSGKRTPGSVPPFDKPTLI